MNRVEVIQYLIDHNNFKKYLEIGVHKGLSFLAVNCNKKIAVDPYFQIKTGHKIKMNLKNPSNFRNKYFEMTSDEFFDEKEHFLEDFGPLDLIFIDGLHTFRGSLKDVLNSFRFIHENGVIVLHDCYPPNKAAATPADSYNEVNRIKPEGWTGLWCGDVWKTVKYLKDKYDTRLEIFTLNTDFGIAVVKQKKRLEAAQHIDEKLFKTIDELDYDYLSDDPQGIINLKDKNYLYQQNL